MKFDEYRIKDGQLENSDAKIIDFGSVQIGEHAEKIRVFKVSKTTEATVSNIKFFLRSIGLITGLKVGFYKASAINKALRPGDSSFTELTVIDEDQPDPEEAGLKSIAEDDYVHLDLSCAITDKGASSAIKLAVIYDYT